MSGKTRKTFDLVDYIMSKRGLYEGEVAGEGGEPIGDGTPSDENKSGELEPTNKDSAPPEPAAEVAELRDWFVKNPKGVKKPLRENKKPKTTKKPCLECGDKSMDKNSTPDALASWFRLGEDEAYNSEAEPEGLPAEESKSDNQKTDVELAKEGGGQSPAAEIKEARILKRKARHLREEADECECKADAAEDKVEDDKFPFEKKEELKEIARLLRRKARRLREEAEETAEKAEDIADKAEAAAEKAVEDGEKKEEKKEDEDAGEAVMEWTGIVAKTGRRMIRESRKRQLASELKRLIEEEEVGLGTPGQNLDAFGADDEGAPKRDAVAAPTTEEELAD